MPVVGNLDNSSASEVMELKREPTIAILPDQHNP